MSKHSQSRQGLTEPAVSVLMSVYNGAAYLEEAIESVLAQSFTSFEFVIVDDGSTDATSALLGDIDDSRVKVLSQENMGLTRSLNRGLQACTGRWIARLDADDIAAPNRLKKQLQHMEEHPETALLGTQFGAIDESGKKALTDNRRVTSDMAIRWGMLFDSVLVHSSFFFKRSAATDLGGYDESFTCSQDYDLCHRLGERGELAILADELVYIRGSKGAVSATRFAEQKRLAARVSRRAMSKLLGRDVSEEARASAWRVVNKPWDIQAEDVEPAVALIDALRQTFLNEHRSPDARRAVRLAHRAMCGRLALPASSPRKQFRNLLLAYKLSPVHALGLPTAAALMNIVRVRK